MLTTPDKLLFFHLENMAISISGCRAILFKSCSGGRDPCWGKQVQMDTYPQVSW